MQHNKHKRDDLAATSEAPQTLIPSLNKHQEESASCVLRLWLLITKKKGRRKRDYCTFNSVSTSHTVSSTDVDTDTNFIGQSVLKISAAL